MNGWGFFLIVLLLVGAGVGAVVYNEWSRAQNTLEVAREVEKQQAAQIKAQGQTIAQQNGQIASLVQDKDTLARQLEQKTAELKKAQETSARIQNENNSLIRANTTLNADKTRLEQSYTALDGEKNRLEQSYAKLAVDKVNLEKINTSMNAERARLESENSAFRAQSNVIPATGRQAVPQSMPDQMPTSLPEETNGPAFPWLLVGGAGGFVGVGAMVSTKILRDTRKARNLGVQRKLTQPGMLSMSVTREEAELLRRRRLNR